MIADGDLEPGIYRVTLDDGSSSDYQLAGVVHTDTGDSLIYQPDEQAEALAGDFRIALGRVQFICDEQGDLYYLPSNRIADIEAVPNERRVDLTYDYLLQSPYAAPVRYELTREQQTALSVVLGLTPVPVEDAESPENGPVEAEGESDTNDPKPPAPDALSGSEQSSASETPSGTSESPPPPSPKSPRRSSPPQSAESSTSGPAVNLQAANLVTLDSPVLETPSPLDAAPIPAELSAAPSGPGDRVTATEILIVNVED